jgi:hypothetical protein
LHGDAQPECQRLRKELSRASGVVKPPNDPFEEKHDQAFAGAIAALSLLAVTAPADAKGCIKGLIHVLPTGFDRIRHCGLLAGGNLALGRKLLDVAPQSAARTALLGGELGAGADILSAASKAIPLMG